MEKDFQWWLVKADRVAAWTLMAVILLFFITGYGMTNGIIDRQFAAAMHKNILPLFGIVAFAIHTGLAVRMTLLRWRIWNRSSAAILVFFYVLAVSAVGYAGLVYEPATGEGGKIETGTVTTNKDRAELPVFSAQTLAEYDGQNGKPAYVAIDGTVYDASSLFRKGPHHGCKPGQDVTDEFNGVTEHIIKAVLNQYEIVGTYKAK